MDHGHERKTSVVHRQTIRMGLELALRLAGMVRLCRVARVALWNCVSASAPSFRSLDSVDGRPVGCAVCSLPHQGRDAAVALGRARTSARAIAGGPTRRTRRVASPTTPFRVRARGHAPEDLEEFRNGWGLSRMQRPCRTIKN